MPRLLGAKPTVIGGCYTGKRLENSKGPMSKPYSEKLKHPRWQQKRLRILQRDGFRCLYCHRDEQQLDVHHHVYVRGQDPWEVPDAYLSSLCRDCHEERQELEGKLKTAITLALKGVPNERFAKVAQWVMGEAMKELER